MRLIVGLGNPDPEYQWTPHNLGFMAVDGLANRGSIRVERPEGKALVGRGKLAGEDVVLAKPQTYMNLSGISVRELLAKYDLGPGDLLVLWDEVQLPFGTIRIDRRGSGGSHNGANSVISAVGTQDFFRLRLGCGPDHPLSSRKEFVLRPMKKAELEVAAEMVGEAGDAVEMILANGIDAAMNKFNRRKLPEAEEPETE
ncbi:MAG TPA: aminoacyl-tRNA hydrolase [Candidatus Acidoferrum sp.]|nr:aminoacyl-tRNA hydrolase [Candidatus Acidoferrum sp.]